MARDAREWSVPEPLRALLWWPLVSFVIGIAAPEAAVVAIILSGLLLATAGVLAPALARRRNREPSAAVPGAVEPVEMDAAA